MDTKVLASLKKHGVSHEVIARIKHDLTPRTMGPSLTPVVIRSIRRVCVNPGNYCRVVLSRSGKKYRVFSPQGMRNLRAGVKKTQAHQKAKATRASVNEAHAADRPCPIHGEPTPA